MNKEEADKKLQNTLEKINSCYSLFNFNLKKFSYFENVFAETYLF